MLKQEHPGLFLTLEGIEGVGKSTAVKFIQDYLNAANQTFLTTREPGGTAIAEQIRKVLLTPSAEEDLQPITELLLMFACRAQHVALQIKPALARGEWVICDRFVDASYAYQGAGRGFDLAQLAALDKWVVGATQPDVTILLDAAPSLGLARAKKRGPQDRIEQEQIAFFERVRNGYLARANAEPTRFHIIDATLPLSSVQAEIKAILDLLMQGKISHA